MNLSQNVWLDAGVILELSDRGEVLRHNQDFIEKFWSKFGFPYILYIFTSPLPQDREVSQLRDFSPKSPSRITPGLMISSEVWNWVTYHLYMYFMVH